MFLQNFLILSSTEPKLFILIKNSFMDCAGPRPPCLTLGHKVFSYIFFFFLIYLLIMLLQLSHFRPFTPFHPADPLPPTFPPYSSCPLVILISSLTSTFPTLFLPSPCLFSTYHLGYLFSVPLPPFPFPLPY